MSNKKLAQILSLIAAVAIVLIVALLSFRPAQKDSIAFEVVKILVQFLFVGVLGVIISLLVQNYNRQRDKELLVNDLRKAVLANLIRAYSDTKKARRIIMGNRLSKGMIPYRIYDEQMRSIIDTQLALEILNHQIATSHTYFGRNVKEVIIKNIEAMEKYLGQIIDEYKDSVQKFEKYPETLTFSSLPKLGSTMGREKELNNFRQEFVMPYRAAVAEIREQILH